jgi:2-dehydropantoate 2-reductase
MRYVIYGAGAIGTAIGSLLKHSGQDVLLITRGAHLDAVRKGGVQIRWRDRSHTVEIDASDRLNEANAAYTECVIVSVKLQDSAASLTTLSQLLDDRVPIVCAQNGVDGERQAARFFRHVYPMYVGLRVSLSEPGVIEFGGVNYPGLLDVGCYPAGTDDFVQTLTGELAKAGFESQPDPEISGRRYEKLLRNLTNALDAAIGPDARRGELAGEICDEGRRCLAGAGIAVGSAQGQARHHLVGGPLPGRADSGQTSSWQSLARASGTVETAFLNGEIALLGRIHGIPTPLNSGLVSLLVRLAARRVPPGSMSEQDVRSFIGGME